AIGNTRRKSRMGNFARTVRVALRYRLTVASSVVCALIVAALWGANISFLLPLVEVVANNQSLSQRLDEAISHSQKNLDTSAEEERKLSEQLAATPADDLQARRRLAHERTAIEVERTATGEELSRLQRLKPWIDDYLPHDPFRTLVWMVAFLLVATIIKDTFLTTNSFLVSRLGQLATFDLRKQFYRRTLRMDLASFNESGTSDLLSRFTYDVDNLAGGIQTLFGRAVLEPLKMVVCLALAAYICWQLLFLSLVVAPLAGLLIVFLSRTLKRANRKALEEMSTLYAILAETFGGIKIVKAFTMERHERRRFHAISKKCYGKAMRIAFFDGLINPVTEVMGISTICLATLAGAYLVMNSETHLLGIRMSSRPLTLSELLAFYGMLAGVSDPARRLTEVFNKLQRAAAAADRVYQLLDREPSVQGPTRPVPFARHHRDLVFDRLSFSYTSEQPVLEAIDLRVPFGETLAIVGPNGCGKSTLLNMIPRFFDPISGEVRLDGVPLDQMRLIDLRKQIGLVTQETLLFDDTVLNNIRYGSRWATREQVIEAAKQAHAHKFIEQKLEQGYQTMVGQGGGRLSGGQRQRIALARAILRDPAILILDEATSQIDLESEQLIHKVLEQFIRNRTTLIVTHRLATLALADRIVVMNLGRIADVGTHEQLIHRCDIYQRLHQIQFRETA
ncbi:MAG TPA: ABC transporter ATP-binding protein, partial [Pirellulales bacterium]|nr:ABC transporter ATP-binding protein [Pirellulales bacterium]